MYARPKLTDSVSVEEMLTMRECGLCNAEIAKRLDTTPTTIYKYIGKQPKELNRPTGWAGRRAKQEAKALESQRKEEAEARKKADALWQEKLEAALAAQAEEEARAVTVDENENLDIFGVKELPEQKPVPVVFTCDADKLNAWEGGLKVISRITHVESRDYRYTLDSSNGTVKISNKRTAETVSWSKASLEDYLSELTEVLGMMN